MFRYIISYLLFSILSFISAIISAFIIFYDTNLARKSFLIFLVILLCYFNEICISFLTFSHCCWILCCIKAHETENYAKRNESIQLEQTDQNLCQIEAQSTPISLPMDQFCNKWKNVCNALNKDLLKCVFNSASA